MVNCKKIKAQFFWFLNYSKKWLFIVSVQMAIWMLSIFILTVINNNDESIDTIKNFLNFLDLKYLACIVTGGGALILAAASIRLKCQFAIAQAAIFEVGSTLSTFSSIILASIMSAHYHNVKIIGMDDLSYLLMCGFSLSYLIFLYNKTEYLHENLRNIDVKDEP